MKAAALVVRGLKLWYGEGWGCGRCGIVTRRFFCFFLSQAHQVSQPTLEREDTVSLGVPHVHAHHLLSI